MNSMLNAKNKSVAPILKVDVTHNVYIKDYKGVCEETETNRDIEKSVMDVRPEDSVSNAGPAPSTPTTVSRSRTQTTLQDENRTEEEEIATMVEFLESANLHGEETRLEDLCLGDFIKLDQFQTWGRLVDRTKFIEASLQPNYIACFVLNRSCVKPYRFFKDYDEYEKVTRIKLEATSTYEAIKDATTLQSVFTY